MAINPQVNSQDVHSLVKSFLSNYYKELKSRLGDTKKVLVVGTKQTDDQIPFSLCVRAVLEADGKKVEYVDRKNWYDAGKIYHGLHTGNVKTIVVENNEEGVSHLPLTLSRNIIKRPEHYNPENFIYVKKDGIFDPEQTFALSLAYVLNTKFKS